MTVGSGGTTISKPESILSKTDTVTYGSDTNPYTHGLISIWMGTMTPESFNSSKIAVAYCNLSYDTKLIGYLTSTISGATEGYVNGYVGGWESIDKSKICTLSIALNGLKIGDKILIQAKSFHYKQEYVQKPLIINASITNITSTTTEFVINKFINPSCTIYDIINSSNTYMNFKCISVIPI